MIEVDNTTSGIVRVRIHTHLYGLTGKHWKKILSGPRHGGFGRVFIYRPGGRENRMIATESMRGIYVRRDRIDIDECPGAMFSWEAKKDAHAEFVDATSNRKLGRAVGHALSRFGDFMEVRFEFT